MLRSGCVGTRRFVRGEPNPALYWWWELRGVSIPEFSLRLGPMRACELQEPSSGPLPVDRGAVQASVSSRSPHV